jgi:hypothetical protein
MHIPPMKNDDYYVFVFCCRVLREEHYRGLKMECSRLCKDGSDLQWNNADLFFLCDTLRHGMPVDRVAGFLSRSGWEVRAKARELKVSIAEPAQRKTA